MRIVCVQWFSIIFCCIYWIYLSVDITVVFGQIVEDQQSFLKLKNNLKFKSQNSAKLESWHRSIECCEWRGVTCDEEGHVIGLDLSGESIYGGFDNSSSLFSLQNLQSLNLATNNFNSVIPSGFNKLKNLTYLNLSNAGFVGQIPTEITHLTRLVTLDISSLYNAYKRSLKLENLDLQKLVQNLTRIRQLYLDGVNVIAEGHEWCNALLQLPGLQELSMSNCNLSGPLDPSLTRLDNLSIIRLDQNNLLSIVPEVFATFPNLTTLNLSSCGLTGIFPEKIFQVATLSVVDISYNENLYGSMPEFPLHESLQTLIVSNTGFSGPLPVSISNLRQLSILDLSNCQFNSTLPISMSRLRELTYLHLSFNNFTGPIPSLNMSKNLTHLDLSHNDLTGSITSVHLEGLRKLVQIDLQNNSLNGHIPSSLSALPLLRSIQLNNNNFQGQLDEFSSISSSMLEVLDLSSNSLEGSIPTSIFHLRSLKVLQLSSNKLSGTLKLDVIERLANLTTLHLSHNIPDSFPASCALRILNLNGNLMEGPIPKSLANCRSLEVLDLGNNQVNDGFPCFLKSLSTLRVMVLRGNKFHGPIVCPHTNGTWHMLQVVDLASNNFSGLLPGELFKTWDAMMLDEGHDASKFYYTENGDIYYQDSVNLTGLYLQIEFVKTLSFVPSVDFSSNNFQGPIPEELMNFTGLHVLNLSHNAFTGLIPSSIGNLKPLESLDLSSNNFDGEIPPQLVNLSFLSCLNLSFNLLVGEIPRGGQLDTFDEDSYLGNEDLHEIPLIKCCSHGVSVSPHGRLHSTDWKIIGAELGLIFGFGLVIGPLMFWKQWRQSYWKRVDSILCFIFPQLNRCHM